MLRRTGDEDVLVVVGRRDGAPVPRGRRAARPTRASASRSSTRAGSSRSPDELLALGGAAPAGRHRRGQRPGRRRRLRGRPGAARRRRTDSAARLRDPARSSSSTAGAPRCWPRSGSPRRTSPARSSRLMAGLDAAAGRRVRRSPSRLTLAIARDRALAQVRSSSGMTTTGSGAAAVAQRLQHGVAARHGHDDLVAGDQQRSRRSRGRRRRRGTPRRGRTRGRSGRGPASRGAGWARRPRACPCRSRPRAPRGRLGGPQQGHDVAVAHRAQRLGGAAAGSARRRGAPIASRYSRAAAPPGRPGGVRSPTATSSTPARQDVRRASGSAPTPTKPRPRSQRPAGHRLRGPSDGPGCRLWPRAGRPGGRARARSLGGAPGDHAQRRRAIARAGHERRGTPGRAAEGERQRRARARVAPTPGARRRRPGPGRRRAGRRRRARRRRSEARSVSLTGSSCGIT